MLDLVDYSWLSSPDRDVGGSYTDISAYNTDYFEPSASRHNHLHSEDMEPIGQEGTAVSSATTIGIGLITIVRTPIISFHQSVGFLESIRHLYRYAGCQFAFTNVFYFC